MAQATWTVCHETVTSACEQDCSSCLRRLIEEGHSIDSENDDGYRPLHICASKNYVQCLTLLLRHADCNIESRASEYDETALMIAAGEGNLESCRELVLAGANVNARTCYRESALYYAMDKNHHACVRYLCEQKICLSVGFNYNWELPLNYAAYHCDVNMLTILLNHGADIRRSIDMNGFNPLMSALRSRAIDKFLFLMNHLEKTCHRATIVTIVNHLSSDSRHGQIKSPYSALCIAAQLDNPEIVKILLNAGADPNVFVDKELTDERHWQEDGNPDQPMLLPVWTRSGGPGIEIMYRGYFTLLTLMIQDRKSLRSIEIMMNAGARWHYDRDHDYGDCVPPHFFWKDADVMKMLIRHGMNPNLYNLDYFAFSITVMTVFPYPDLLSTWLLHGGEADTCFKPLPHAKHVLTFGNVAWKYKDNIILALQDEEDEVEIIDFYKSLLILLKHVAAPGYLPWFMDLVEDSNERLNMEAICCTPSSLMHLCRVKIRHFLSYNPCNLLQPNILKETLTKLDLPVRMIEYISYSCTAQDDIALITEVH